MTAFKKILALILCLATLLTIFGSLTLTADEIVLEETVVEDTTIKMGYEEYLNKNKDMTDLSSDFDFAEFVTETNSKVQTQAVRIIDSQNPYSLVVTVPQGGWYNIGLKYMQLTPREEI